MPVVGTAGHVDHGKSTLVEALTGRNPDRWEEEKRRGLTIDLGFAWAVLPNGAEVSFVDVPGHERFIKNMLAGIEAIDVALLVVAADEGWAAQSEEHLAVLDLLEVNRGLVAITKADRVDPETAELAALEAAEKLEGTSMSGSPVVIVSAATGQGIDTLVEELSRAVATAARPGSGRSRMWVDRSFTIAGAGTVVTGTLLEGPLSIDERVELWPNQEETRIRSIQSHERSVEKVEPFRRVALNLSGIDRGEITRGAMLGRPGQWRPTRRVAVTIRPARYVEGLTEKGAYHLHLGSGAWPVRLRLLEPDVGVLHLPVPLSLEMGDRFILRETGRRAVVGGGRVLDPAPAKTSRPIVAGAPGLRQVLDGSPDEKAAALLALRRSSPIDELSAHTGGGAAEGVVVVEGTAYAPAVWEEFSQRLEREIGEFHRQHPLRPGIAASTIGSQWGTGAALVESVASRNPALKVKQGLVCAVGHVLDRDSAQERGWEEAKARLKRSGLAVPRITELGIDRELLHALIREGLLVRVSDDLVYLPEQIDQMERLARQIQGPFTVSQFKDAAGISRKYAVPVLEWTDQAGITRRSGDLRTVQDRRGA
jgi:selenocysteine-specific elongation factor